MATENLTTLDELRERFGAPAAATLEAMAPASARERFIERGRQIRSSHIITDSARIYGYACAYWQKATPAERGLLIGVSEELLRLAIDRALALRDANLDREDATHDEKVALSARVAAASEAFSRGLAKRDQARTALRTVTAVDPKLGRALRVAEGTELTGPEALATSLERIAAFGAELVARGDAAISARLTLAGITADYFVALAADGAKVRETARAADVLRNVKKLSQSEVDYLDGLNLELLGHVVAAFESASGLDPAVPRLAPIATRRMFSGGRKPKAGAEPDVAELSPEPAVSE